jgi:hypothetical protein
VPALIELTGRPSLELIINTVKNVAHEDDVAANRMSIYFCHRYSGAKLKENGARFGVGESAVPRPVGAWRQA